MLGDSWSRTWIYIKIMLQKHPCTGLELATPGAKKACTLRPCALTTRPPRISWFGKFFRGWSFPSPTSGTKLRTVPTHTNWWSCDLCCLATGIYCKWTWLRHLTLDDSTMDGHFSATGTYCKCMNFFCTWHQVTAHQHASTINRWGGHVTSIT